MNSHSTGQTISPLVYSFYVFAIGTILDLFLAFPYGVERALNSEPSFWFHIFYLSVISTTFGTTVYFFASTKLGSRVASSFIFLVPVTALLGSWIFLNESPSFTTTIGGAFAVLAVFLLNRNRNDENKKERTWNYNRKSPSLFDGPNTEPAIVLLYLFQAEDTISRVLRKKSQIELVLKHGRTITIWNDWKKPVRFLWELLRLTVKHKRPFSEETCGNSHGL